MTATEAEVTGPPGTEISLRRPRAQPSAIPAKLAYAQALAESGLLPGAYRKQPANILWAVEYGDMLGLSTMAAITGVHVIEGKPTASAGLISALVRRAGHKLRVTGNGKSATCVIIRSDDPGHPFEVTWTLKRNDDGNPSAEEAKLLSKPVWQQYPASMLKSRAITQCARDACEEALFGLHYTPEELGAEVDEDGVVVDDAPPQQPAAQLAERSGGTPDDDQWYVRPDPDAGAAEGGRPWTVERAVREARTFKTEAQGAALWREAAARHLAGDCDKDDQDLIQNCVAKRIAERRKEAAARILRQLPESDEWRLKVEDLRPGDDDTAREWLEELGQLKAAGTMAEDRANLVGRAVIALCPKAAVKAGDGDA